MKPPSPSEELAALSLILLNAKEHKFAFLTFKNIQQEIGLEKSRTVEYLRLLSKAEIISYDFMPFGNFVRKSMFSQEEEIEDDIGAFVFNLRESLENMTKPEGASSFLEKNPLSPEAQFDIQKRELLVEGKSVDMGGSPAYIALCEILFSKPQGTFFDESDVASYIEERDPDAKTNYRGLYNIKNQVNIKVKNVTGIKNFIDYKQGRLWVN